MAARKLPVLFGLNVDPSKENIDNAFHRAAIADDYGLDLITIQDHPYIVNFLETWTLLAALGMATERVHLGTNVLSTPLRPPAMLAKQAATLDVLTDGRVELGVGAGASPEGIRAFGGPDWSASERYRAFKEYVQILRGMWEHAGGSYSFDGEFYRVRGARPGPAPAHRIRLWFGATGDQMLRLTGQLADGLLISTSYVQPEQLDRVNRLIDEGAEEAGRAPSEIRRGYNLMGVLDLDRSDTKLRSEKPGLLNGPIDYWVDTIERFHHDYRQDTFTFWPVAGNERVQIEAFAREVVPAVHERIDAASS